MNANIRAQWVDLSLTIRDEIAQELNKTREAQFARAFPEPLDRTNIQLEAGANGDYVVSVFKRQKFNVCFIHGVGDSLRAAVDDLLAHWNAED